MLFHFLRCFHLLRHKSSHLNSEYSNLLESTVEWVDQRQDRRRASDRGTCPLTSAVTAADRWSATTRNSHEPASSRLCFFFYNSLLLCCLESVAIAQSRHILWNGCEQAILCGKLLRISCRIRIFWKELIIVVEVALRGGFKWTARRFFPVDECLRAKRLFRRRLLLLLVLENGKMQFPVWIVTAGISCLYSIFRSSAF